jgi:hypothetical protein
VGAGVKEVGACGDKFLVGLRGGAGLRWAGAVQPTRLLIYWQAEPGEEPDVEAEALFRSALEEAGHSVTIVKDTGALYREASSRRFEVMMMEIDTARGEQGRLEAVSPDASILPVLHFGSRKERSAAKKEFGQVVRTPTTLDDLLWSIEKARLGG